MARVKIEDLKVERTLEGKESAGVIGGAHRRSQVGLHGRIARVPRYYGLWDPVPGYHGGLFDGPYGGHHGEHRGGHYAEH